MRSCRLALVWVCFWSSVLWEPLNLSKPYLWNGYIVLTLLACFEDDKGQAGNMRAQSPSMNKSSVRHSYGSYDCYLCRLTVRFCPSSLAFRPFICLLLLHVIPLFLCSVRIDYFKKIIIQNHTLRAYKNTFTYIILILKIHFHFSADTQVSNRVFQLTRQTQDA